MKKKSIWWGITIIIMLVIFYFSSQDGTHSSALSESVMERFFKFILNDVSDSQQELLHTFIRKMGHFSIYLVLGIAVFNLIRCYRTQKAFIFSLLICVFYAISDEIHQSFVGGRSPAVTDVLIDLAGSFVGIGCTLIIVQRIQRKQQKRLADDMK